MNSMGSLTHKFRLNNLENSTLFESPQVEHFFYNNHEKPKQESM